MVRSQRVAGGKVEHQVADLEGRLVPAEGDAGLAGQADRGDAALLAHQVDGRSDARCRVAALHQVRTYAAGHLQHGFERVLFAGYQRVEGRAVLAGRIQPDSRAFVRRTASSFFVTITCIRRAPPARAAMAAN